MKKRIGILGCSGSIGKQTLDVIRDNSDKFDVTLLANKSDKDCLVNLKMEFPNAETYFDTTEINCSQIYDNCDIVVNGIVGLSGLLPTMAVIKSKSKLASANKESIICAGELINKELNLSNKQIIPIDSEHSTIFQCLMGEKSENLDKIILTASGGAFRDFDYETLKKATAKQALNHPTWKMGKKVTIDCATLMNKGMEIIEAKHLFGTKNIDVVIHRESVVHSFVKFKDKNYKACLSSPDMRLPIQFALTYPDRLDIQMKDLDLFNLDLTFRAPNYELFPCLKIAKQIQNDSEATIMNSANDALVTLYQADKIAFYDIPKFIIMALEKFNNVKIMSINDIFDIDRNVKEYINHIKVNII